MLYVFNLKGRGLHQRPQLLAGAGCGKFFRDQLQLDDEVNSQIADRYTVGS